MKRRTKGTRARAGRHVLAGALAAAAIAASPNGVADDIFLKLDGIDGESQDAKHPKEIDVLSWSWVFARTPAAPACAQELHFTKVVDRATPLLLTRATTGATIATGRLAVLKSGSSVEYLTLALNGVTVRSIHPAASAGGGVLEAVSLAWNSGVLTYRQQDPSTGGIIATLTSNLPPTCVPPQPAGSDGRSASAPNLGGIGATAPSPDTGRTLGAAPARPRQNDPNIEPSAITATSATIGPTMPAITMSK